MIDESDRREPGDRRQGIGAITAAQHVATLLFVFVLFGLGWLAGHFGP